MPSRSYPIGLGSTANIEAVLGTRAVISLITKAAGTAQGGYVAERDIIVVTGANSSNTAITIPDPALTGYGPADFYEFVNGTSQACVIFPPTGGNIDGAGANASIPLAANKCVRVYVTTVASGASTFNSLRGA